MIRWLQMTVKGSTFRPLAIPALESTAPAMRMGPSQWTLMRYYIGCQEDQMTGIEALLRCQCPELLCRTGKQRIWKSRERHSEKLRQGHN